MSNLGKKFLKPVSALIASLLATSLQSGAKANPILENAAEKALGSTDMESSEGRPSPDQLILGSSEQGPITLDHYSHSSHSSHSSHVSGYN